MTLSLVALADECRLTLDELRSRLFHAGIGASGHGTIWESRVLSLCRELTAANGGVLSNQVVGAFQPDDAMRIEAAAEQLRDRLRAMFSKIPEGKRNAQELEDLRTTPFKVWIDRDVYRGPAGENLGMGYRLNFSVPPDARPEIHKIIAGMPDSFQGYELWNVNEQPQSSTSQERSD